MQSFAILGSHPTLSLAELAVVTGKSPHITHHDVAIFDDIDPDLVQLNARLGGVQRLGVIIGSVTAWNHDELAAFLSADLAEQCSSGKISFGFSVFDCGNTAATADARRNTQALGIETKQHLKLLERSARYVISKSPTLSSIVVRTNHLLDRGAEYCFLVTPTEILIGKTIAVQDAEAWSTRDFGRPRRNAKQGMLPPKLSRMMMNYADVDFSRATVFDPFCGSGTILMEAALLGASSLIGSDINADAITDTEENLAWLETQHVSVPPMQLITASAQTVAQHITPQSVDCIVTETYLGRPRKGTETKKEVDDAIAYVANLYAETFSALLPCLKPGATLVIASPVHVFDGKDVTFDTRAILEPLGYRHNPLPYEPLVYRHTDQLVGRRIWRFKT
jgi:tRNA G10  N-methylase Trm11